MPTVLIVDDSEMLLNYLEDSFKQYKNTFDIVFASNGLEAMDVLKSQPVSLLITDLQMPEIDGLGLLAYIQKYHQSLPSIVMSAHGTPALVEKLQNQILSFISKPFSAEKLADVITSALKQGKPDGSLTGISISSFLQLVEMEQKTCICSIESLGHPKGFFYFQGGELFHAIYGNLKGEEAAIAMVQLEDITINFRDPPTRKIPRAINKGLMTLLLEGMQQKDEEGPVNKVEE